MAEKRGYQRYTLPRDTIVLNMQGLVAVYHRIFGGLTLLNTKSMSVLMGFKGGKWVPNDLLEREAVNREEELLQQLAIRGLINPYDNSSSYYENSIQQENKISVIQLIMANACNFGCTYCFEGKQGSEELVKDEFAKLDGVRVSGSGETKIDINDPMYASKDRLRHQYDPKNRRMKPEKGVGYVQKALEVALDTGVDEVMVQFFGGEPLLNWTTISEVLSTFKDKYKDIKINYSIVTNGSL